MNKLTRLVSIWNAWSDASGAREDASPISRPFDDFDESALELVSDAVRRDSARLRRAGRRAARLGAQLLLASLVGVLAGLAGSAFLYGMNLGTNFFLHSESSALTGGFRSMLLLPLAGVFIVWIYRRTKLSVDAGTNMVIESLVSEKKPSLWLAPLIFVSSIVTQSFGGSAGREGAAIQLGGCVGLGTGRALRLRDSGLRLAIYCGMAGGFAAVFGAPLTAAVFAVEVGCVGVVYYPAFLPALTSATVAAGVASSFGFSPFFHALPAFPATSAPLALRVLALGLFCGAASVFFCSAIRRASASMAQHFPNDYVRVVFGGLAVVAATALLGTTEYNGTGLTLIQEATEGRADWYDFILKALFTAVTLGAGYKGGEIVPALAVGATFGCCVGGALGLDPTLGASLGMVSVFCGATNCPLASLILSVEFFGAENALLFALACTASYMSSARMGLYRGQRVVFSKATDAVCDARLRTRLKDDLASIDASHETTENIDALQFKNDGKNCRNLEETLFSDKLR